MLLHDDVVRHRETKAGSFTGWLGREERVEYLFLHFGRDAGAVVAKPNFHGLSEVLRGGPEGWLKTRLFILRLALGRSIDAVSDQIEKCAGDFLRKQFDCACVRIEVALQGDIELALFGACAMIGEIETFIEQRIDIRRSVLSGAF